MYTLLPWMCACLRSTKSLQAHTSTLNQIASIQLNWEMPKATANHIRSFHILKPNEYVRSWSSYRTKKLNDKAFEEAVTVDERIRIYGRRIDFHVNMATVTFMPFMWLSKYWNGMHPLTWTALEIDLIYLPFFEPKNSIISINMSNEHMAEVPTSADFSNPTASSVSVSLLVRSLHHTHTHTSFALHIHIWTKK